MPKRPSCIFFQKMANLTHVTQNARPHEMRPKAHNCKPHSWQDSMQVYSYWYLKDQSFCVLAYLQVPD